MESKLKAPAVKNYANCLKRLDYRGYNSNISYDEATYPLLDELFTLIKPIEPTSSNGARELWLKAERGTIEDYGDYEEMYAYGEVSSREEYEQLWKSDFPEEIEWFHFAAIEDVDRGYRCVFLNHRIVIEEDQSKENDGFPYEISEFVEWLIESVKAIIEELKDGTYNRLIQNELPVWHRTGTILRKYFWDVYPDLREEFFADISEEDTRAFISYMQEQNDGEACCGELIQDMTAAKFYQFCALGYKENHYNYEGLTPKEQYYKYADGRDEGLGQINMDSVEAFSDWYHNRNMSGHPWEVCRGGNSTHISLYVRPKEDGWRLTIAGDAWTRTIESVKFYLALRREGLPVYMMNGKLLAERLLGDEKIGIVPKGVFPVYCFSWFSDEDIIDFINLDYDDRERLSPYCVWNPINDVRFIEEK